MKEINSMLVQFQKLCKNLNQNFLKYILDWRITWSTYNLATRISQKASCYLESENANALISFRCSALQWRYPDTR